MSMDKEIALVTGASRGIGRAIAEELGRQGAFVVGTATSEAGAAGISERFAQAAIRGDGVVLDIADGDAIEETVTTVTKQHGAPTVLINNAGITRDNLLMRMKESEWDEVVNTNLNSVYRLCKACVRGMMKARRGRIVNIASMVALSGNPGQTNYAAAKAGMIGFTKSLAREVGSRGITVNVVAPGIIDTDMTRVLPEEQRQALLQGVPLKRLGTPEEVAQTVSFLTSPGAAYITGETIHVNGGMYMV